MIVIGLLLVFIGGIIQVMWIPSLREMVKQSSGMSEEEMTNNSFFGIILIIAGIYIIRTCWI